MMNGDVKILLVDDQQLVRQRLRQLIEDEPGLTVVGETFNCQSAANQIRIRPPNLVLLKHDLPEEEDDRESIRRLIAEFPAIKIIALSNRWDLELVFQALHAGVSGFVVKKHGSEELFQAIHAVMEFHLYLSPEVSSAVTRYFMNSYRGPESARADLALSDRERMLLRLIAQGHRAKDIAGTMSVAVRSAETFRFRLMKKLGCASTAELVRYAIRAGIVQA
jgi:DNA-binding NarL/FixJ family response regulator